MKLALNLAGRPPVAVYMSGARKQPPFPTGDVDTDRVDRIVAMKTTLSGTVDAQVSPAPAHGRALPGAVHRRASSPPEDRAAF
jgi:hypothetical protein